MAKEFTMTEQSGILIGYCQAAGKTERRSQHPREADLAVKGNVQLGGRVACFVQFGQWPASAQALILGLL